MKKILLKKLIPFALVFSFVFVASGFLESNVAEAQADLPPCRLVDGRIVNGPSGVNCDSGTQVEQGSHTAVDSGLSISKVLSFATDVLAAPIGWLAVAVLQLATLLTYLAGALLNLIVFVNLVEMGSFISNSNSDFIGNAWRVIRDVANMAFIFILLYAAIQTIFGVGSDNKKLIVKIVLVAILINFSLFFTKVVIDASNVLAIFMYDRIAPGALNSTGGIFGITGIANQLMDPLKLTSIWDSNQGLGQILDGSKLLTIGALGTIFTLIATFVLFAVAIMFVIRFVVLIFVLILSPLAFISFILPQMNGQRKKWVDALIGQAFFAPIYFLLTWVVIAVSKGVLTSGDGTLANAFGATVSSSGQAQLPGSDDLRVVLNFMIMIVLIIVSLVTAKDWANKAPGGVNKLTGWAMGAAGGATLGLAGRFGRNTIGSRAEAMANNEDLKKRAAEGSMRARLQLATANKVASSSFDMRGTGLGGVLGAGKAQKGGFKQDQKNRAKSYEKYKPSEDAIKEAEAEQKVAKASLEISRTTAKIEAERTIPKPENLTRAEENLRKAREREAQKPTGLLGVDQRIQNEAAVKAAEARVNTEKEKHEIAQKQFIESRTGTETALYDEKSKQADDLKNRMENMAKRMEGWRGRVRVPGFTASGKVKAEAIRTAAKGKSKKEKLAEAAKNFAEEERVESEEAKPEEEKKEEGGEKKTT